MKQKKLKYILIIILLFGLLLGFTSSTIKEDRDLNFFEKAIKDTSVFIQKIFYSPIKFVKGKIEVFSEKEDIYKKYTNLKEKVEKTDIYYSQIQELQKEVAELKSVLELNATISEYTYINATVVNRNIVYWYNYLTIDKGSKNGIKKGDAVITNKGLIGKVSNVSNFSSTVKLLTSDEISRKISVKVQTGDTFQYGLLIGYDKDKNVYKIEGITDSSKIKENDIVTTTGLTDYFPSGILIGSVSNIVKDEYDLNSIVEVTPSVDFTNFSVVTILNRKLEE